MNFDVNFDNLDSLLALKEVKFLVISILYIIVAFHHF